VTSACYESTQRMVPATTTPRMYTCKCTMYLYCRSRVQPSYTVSGVYAIDTIATSCNQNSPAVLHDHMNQHADKIGIQSRLVSDSQQPAAT